MARVRATGRLRNIGLLVLATLIIGTSWPVGKLALIEIDPWTVRSITVGCSGLLVLALLRLFGKPIRPSPIEFTALAVLAAFNISGWHLLAAFGLRLSEAAHAVVIANTMPIWATFLSAWILAEKVRINSMLALCLMMAGLFTLIGGRFEIFSDRPIGLVLLLLAAWSWAYGTVLQKQLKTELDIVAIAGWQLTLGSIPIVTGMILWGAPGDLAAASSTALSAVGFGLLMNMFLYWLWFRIVDLLEAHVAAIGVAAVPVIGAVASWPILGERLEATEWGALILVVAGLILLAISKREDAAVEPQPIETSVSNKYAN